MAFRDHFDLSIVIVALQAQEQIDDLLRHEENFSRVDCSIHHASNYLAVDWTNGSYQRPINRLNFGTEQDFKSEIHPLKSLLPSQSKAS